MSAPSPPRESASARLRRMVRWPYSGPAKFGTGETSIYVDTALDNIMLPHVEAGRDGDCAWLSIWLGDGSSDPVVGVTLQFPWRRPRPRNGRLVLPPYGHEWPYRLLGLETIGRG